MATHSCANVTSDRSNYLAPVPIIGLYIAAAAMVCSLLIICDVIYGIRRRKLWFPCRFFSLNSATLTLLSIAAKIPVDLTTPMPSALDQLSKLTGTTLICVCMAFLFPSVVASKTSESLANMASLSILVITVIVNICIQMSTRLIFSFILEHVIIMFFMLSLLCISWVATLLINEEKEHNTYVTKIFFVHPRGSMLNQLKMLYILSYNFNPQFVLCRETFSSLTSLVSFLCLTLLLQAMLRSGIPYESRWFNGTSDYGWSMNVIVGTQILLIFLGSSATCFRQFILWPVQQESSTFGKFWEDICYPFREFSHLLYIAVKPVVYSLYFIMITVLHAISNFLCGVFCSCFDVLICGPRKIGRVEDPGDLQFGFSVQAWTIMKCEEDMKRVKGSTESGSISSLTQILSKPSLSEQSLQQLHNHLSEGRSHEVSCLDMVMVVTTASVSIPSRLSGSLTPILHEIFDVIHFVDTKLHSSELKNRENCKLAKDWCMENDLSKVLPKILMGSTDEPYQPQSDLDRARRIMQDSKSDFVHYGWGEFSEFFRSISFIEDQEYTSIEKLYNYMELIFVYMVRELLSQLPEAIGKEVSESSNIEELEEKVRYMLKLLWKIESLEDKFQWSFPDGTDFTRLITEAPVTSQHHMTTMDNAAPDTHDIEDVDDNNVRDAHVDEIIEVV